MKATSSTLVVVLMFYFRCNNSDLFAQNSISFQQISKIIIITLSPYLQLKIMLVTVVCCVLRIIAKHAELFSE